ncbi:MAG: hypothetical protein A2Y89_04725 [Chloroflexi bacterium RBG_13_51_18]|nr:MAG: hypothetical protein A2Y89_04725 [Chloroflexi bacterium RBG_13_51_18]
MAECELLKGCIFFNDKMKVSDALGEMYKRRFCLGSNSECARYMVFKKLGRENVPPDLFPNMYDRAKRILAGK